MKQEHFTLRPASREEAGLFYSDEGQDEALGTVGHLRMDFGSGGKRFHHTWWPHNGDRFNTPEFKEVLQQFVEAMRKDGPLKDLSSMSKYCRGNGGTITEDDRVHGYIAETEHYRFCLRCTPRPGDYAFILEDTDRMDGEGFAYFYRELRCQMMDDPDFMANFQDESIQDSEIGGMTLG